jgi:putative chitinase
MTADELLPRLILAGIEPTPARTFAAPLAQTLGNAMTPLRWAHCIGQLRHESQGFTRLEENLRYSPARLLAVFGALRVGGTLDEAARLCATGPKAIANRVYANMLGNGNEASGDGWTYRGGGLIQTTGRANYKAADIKPEDARTPKGACWAAREFMTDNNVWVLMDANDVEGVTRKVNGPRMLGLTERRNFTREAFEAFTA